LRLQLSKDSLTHWHWHPAVLTGLFAWMFSYNLLGGPLFEEFGWRGFLQARLQQVMPPWVAAICVGVLWAAWHAPALPRELDQRFSPDLHSD
jgi:membrane protease YdiL (CAAX protease family)